MMNHRYSGRRGRGRRPYARASRFGRGDVNHGVRRGGGFGFRGGQQQGRYQTVHPMQVGVVQYAPQPVQYAQPVHYAPQPMPQPVQYHPVVLPPPQGVYHNVRNFESNPVNYNQFNKNVQLRPELEVFYDFSNNNNGHNNGYNNGYNNGHIVQDIGGTFLDFVGEEYEEHMHPPQTNLPRQNNEVHERLPPRPSRPQSERRSNPVTSNNDHPNNNEEQRSQRNRYNVNYMSRIVRDADFVENGFDRITPGHYHKGETHMTPKTPIEKEREINKIIERYPYDNRDLRGNSDEIEEEGGKRLVTFDERRVGELTKEKQRTEEKKKGVYEEEEGEGKITIPLMELGTIRSTKTKSTDEAKADSRRRNKSRRGFDFEFPSFRRRKKKEERKEMESQRNVDDEQDDDSSRLDENNIHRNHHDEIGPPSPAPSQLGLPPSLPFVEIVNVGNQSQLSQQQQQEEDKISSGIIPCVFVVFVIPFIVGCYVISDIFCFVRSKFCKGEQVVNEEEEEEGIEVEEAMDENLEEEEKTETVEEVEKEEAEKVEEEKEKVEEEAGEHEEVEEEEKKSLEEEEEFGIKEAIEHEEKEEEEKEEERKKEEEDEEEVEKKVEEEEEEVEVEVRRKLGDGVVEDELGRIEKMGPLYFDKIAVNKDEEKYDSESEEEEEKKEGEEKGEESDLLEEEVLEKDDEYVLSESLDESSENQDQSLSQEEEDNDGGEQDTNRMLLILLFKILSLLKKKEKNLFSSQEMEKLISTMGEEETRLLFDKMKKVKEKEEKVEV